MYSSRYSPRRRSPSRYPSRRDYSPRRRPWSPPPNRNTGVGKPGNNLFVAGFSFGTSERDLEKKFSRYGHVTDVRIIRDRRYVAPNIYLNIGFLGLSQLLVKQTAGYKLF